MGKLNDQNLFEIDMIEAVLNAKMGDKIKLYPLAVVKGMDAKAGATVQIPKTAYIGDAEDVAAGTEIDLEAITQTLDNCIVKKAGKGLVFTQEDINNAYIDVNEEAEKQLLKAIENKIEADLFAELATGTITKNVAVLDVDGLADAVTGFGEDLEDAMYLFVNPADLAVLRKDADFIVNANHGGGIVGSAGMIFGMEVVVTNRVEANAPIILKEGAVALYVKKGVELEVDKNIVNQTYNVVATQHYVAHLIDDTRVIKVTVGEEKPNA